MAKMFNFQRAKELMREKKIDQKDIVFYLSEKGINYTIDGVKNWFRRDEGARTNPEIQALRALAELFKVSLDELIIGASNTVKQNILKRVPIVGSASCGIPDTNAYQEVDEYTYCPADEWNEEMYSVIANGSSMEPDIEEGDELLCDPQATVKDGDIVHYQLDGEGAIKVYVLLSAKNKFCFVPINDKFPTKEFEDTLENRERLRMVKVIKFNRSLENGRMSRLKSLGYDPYCN